MTEQIQTNLNQPEHEWMTAEEAAAHLRINVDTLRRYSTEGLVPAIRIGKFWRFSKQALATWKAPTKEVNNA